jgi:hypothetical protein
MDMSGSMIVNVVPLWGALVTAISPWWARTISRVKYKPKPAPSASAT